MFLSWRTWEGLHATCGWSWVSPRHSAWKHRAQQTLSYCIYRFNMTWLAWSVLLPQDDHYIPELHWRYINSEETRNLKKDKTFAFALARDNPFRWTCDDGFNKDSDTVTVILSFSCCFVSLYLGSGCRFPKELRGEWDFTYIHALKAVFTPKTLVYYLVDRSTLSLHCDKRDGNLFLLRYFCVFVTLL